MVAALNPFAPMNPGLGTRSYPSTAVVTPSDTVDLTTIARALYVGGTGNITLIDANGNTTLFSAIPVGTVLPVACSRVKATGTTATLIVAMW